MIAEGGATHGFAARLRCGAQAVIFLPGTPDLAAEKFCVWGWVLVRGQYRDPDVWQTNGAWAEDGREHPFDIVQQLGLVPLANLPPVSIG